MSAPPCLSVAVEAFPVAGTFTISRGSRREATVVVAALADGQGNAGRGECVPYARYGETVESVTAQLLSVEGVRDRAELQTRLPPGAARNALDCAFWDLDAKRSGKSVASRAGVTPPHAPQLTCYTLSLAPAAEMASAAEAASDKPLLKLKLGGGHDDAVRMRAVRAARPDARIVADANEAWTLDDLAPLLRAAHDAGVELIEQPLPVGQDAALADVADLRRHVPVCADESAHASADVPRLVALYDAVNIKLDKAGGLTEALAMARAAKAVNLRIMVGCMLSTSLSMAPALLLSPFADWLDLDGPLLLARDRTPAMTYLAGHICPAPAELWG